MRWEETRSKKGSKVFREFFLEWTCPTWVERKLHGNKRSSDVRTYFDVFCQSPTYMDVKRMKLNGRTGAFYRGNLQPFFDYASNKEVKFNETEKITLKELFENENDFILGIAAKLIRTEVCNLSSNNIIDGMLELFRESISCFLIEQYPKKEGKIDIRTASYSFICHMIIQNKTLFNKIVKLVFSERTANIIIYAKLKPSSDPYLIDQITKSFAGKKDEPLIKDMF